MLWVAAGLTSVGCTEAGPPTAAETPTQEASLPLQGGGRDGRAERPGGRAAEDAVLADARQLVLEGREVFRFDTFGSEAFWGGALRLHEAIAGEANGGVGPGVSPQVALQTLGLKVDVERVPRKVAQALKAGSLDLNDPANTLALLQADAVVGVKGLFDGTGRLQAVGIRCALCHSTVDDAFAPGIGRRLDGWPNRDLDVGAIIAASPDLTAIAKVLGLTPPEEPVAPPATQDAIRGVLRG